MRAVKVALAGVPDEWLGAGTKAHTAGSTKNLKALATRAAALFTFTSSPRCPLKDAERVPAVYRSTGLLANLALTGVLSLIMTGNEAARDRNRLTFLTFVNRRDQGRARNATTAAREAYVPAVGPTRSRGPWVRPSGAGRHVCPRTGAFALSIGGPANKLAWLARARCGRRATCRRVDQ